MRRGDDVRQAGKIVTHFEGAVSNDDFASDVAISGDRIVVGVSNASVIGGGSAGSAIVYRRDATGWVEETELFANDPEAMVGLEEVQPY